MRSRAGPAGRCLSLKMFTQDTHLAVLFLFFKIHVSRIDVAQEYIQATEARFSGDDSTFFHWIARDTESPAVMALLLDEGTCWAARSCTGRRGSMRARPWSACCSPAARMRPLRDNENRLLVDLADENPALKGTDVYRRLNDARF